jgi:transposase-like protein
VNPAGTNPVGVHKYPEETRLQAVEMYKAGKKPEEIASELGCSAASIYVWATHAGARDPKEGPSKPGRKPQPDMTREERDKLILTMFNQGLTPHVIRKQLSIKGAGTVGDVIRKAGLNPYQNTPENKLPPSAKAPEQTNLALPLSPAEQMLAARATKAQSNEDVHAMRRTIIALRTERDALRRALDEIIGE